MSNVQPPPTWAPITDPHSNPQTPAFNPVWLQYFLQLGSIASATYDTQIPTDNLVSGTQTTSPYTLTVSKLTTVVLSGTISAISYIRHGVSMTLNTSTIDLSPGDSLQITFTGTLTIGQIPR